MNRHRTPSIVQISFFVSSPSQKETPSDIFIYFSIKTLLVGLYQCTVLQSYCNSCISLLRLVHYRLSLANFFLYCKHVQYVHVPKMFFKNNSDELSSETLRSKVCGLRSFSLNLVSSDIQPYSVHLRYLTLCVAEMKIETFQFIVHIRII